MSKAEYSDNHSNSLPTDLGSNHSTFIGAQISSTNISSPVKCRSLVFSTYDLKTDVLIYKSIPWFVKTLPNSCFFPYIFFPVTPAPVFVLFWMCNSYLDSLWQQFLMYPVTIITQWGHILNGG